MQRIIQADRSLIPAADVRSIRDLPRLLSALKGVVGVSAIKPGFTLAFDNLRDVIQMIREFNPDWVTIYDHQKAGCDIPRNGEKFAWKMVEAGVDAVIIFPLAGAETEAAWITALQGAKIPVIVGGEMTHEGFFVSEGGFIADNAPERMFRIAARLGVRDFFLPGNKPGQIEFYRNLISHFTDGEDFTIFSCGFFTQGGDITEAGKEAGKNWHCVVGEAIYEAGNLEEIRAAAERIAAQMLS